MIFGPLNNLIFTTKLATKKWYKVNTREAEQELGTSVERLREAFEAYFDDWEQDKEVAQLGLHKAKPKKEH